MSIHIKGVGSILNTHILNSSVEKNTQNTNNNTAKNLMQLNNNKRSDNAGKTQNNNIKVNNISYSKSHCVEKLNITKMHIDKMQSEVTNKIYNRNIVNKNILNKADKRRHDQEATYQIDEFDEPVLSDLEIYHIGLIKDLYCNVESNKPCFESYIILIIYQTIADTKLISKQLITAIPIENNISKKSISDITIINSSGKLKTYTKTVSFHNGRFAYTDDWLIIHNTQKLNPDSTFYRFKIDYKSQLLNGVAFKNQVSNQFKINNSTIYIPDFSHIWC